MSFRTHLLKCLKAEIAPIEAVCFILMPCCTQRQGVLSWAPDPAESIFWWCFECRYSGTAEFRFLTTQCLCPLCRCLNLLQRLVCGCGVSGGCPTVIERPEVPRRPLCRSQHSKRHGGRTDEGCLRKSISLAVEIRRVRQ